MGPGTLVGLYLLRSPELVISLLAVLKAGGAYLPLDPGAPTERTAYILGDASAAFVLVRSTSARPPDVPECTEVLEVDRLDLTGHPSGPPHPAAGPADLAYVIYTSGSTGRPKGVMVEHRNMSGFCAAMDEVFSAPTTHGESRRPPRSQRMTAPLATGGVPSQMVCSASRAVTCGDQIT
ncbi:AMP-binding protein [Kitasatospora sp. NPDC087315]|uniref:AMP-binding protein n=1 Tax=Kitasatospora sp. NPDC087315 TaxID=3364069 RepID=UPI0037F9BB3F